MCLQCLTKQLIDKASDVSRLSACAESLDLQDVQTNLLYCNQVPAAAESMTQWAERDGSAPADRLCCEDPLTRRRAL